MSKKLSASEEAAMLLQHLNDVVDLMNQEIDQIERDVKNIQKDMERIKNG